MCFIFVSTFQVFQQEIEGKEVCLDFIIPVNRETIVTDAKKAALAIQASTARVILIFCWYTDARQVLIELAKRNVGKHLTLISSC